MNIQETLELIIEDIDILDQVDISVLEEVNDYIRCYLLDIEIRGLDFND